MKALSVLFIISVLFWAAGCSENSSLITPENNTVSKVPVPFKLNMEGFLTVIPTSLTEGTTLIELTGTGTHVGKFSGTSTNNYVVTSLTTGYGFNGVHTMTTASGEELYGIYTASWIINPDGLYDYTLTIELTGGTGRFEGITGEYTLAAIGINIDPLNPLYKTVTGQGDGWILFQ